MIRACEYIVHSACSFSRANLFFWANISSKQIFIKMTLGKGILTNFVSGATSVYIYISLEFIFIFDFILHFGVGFSCGAGPVN